MSDHTTLTPTVEQATSGLANISLGPDASGNDTDSTGSVPDLVPASDSDNDADESGSDVHMHPATPVIRTDTRAVNGNTNPTINIDSPVRGGSFHLDHQANSTNGHRVANHIHAAVQTTASPTTQNWRVPAHLAHRALRDAVADRFTNQGPAHRPVGNTFRRGGAPYPMYGGRALNGEMIYDLIVRLQRLERALHGLADHAEQHWFPRF
ncbi:hypothetical protein B0H11DRAFT_1932018 [Mycena galericulata]|nr:hypothetical protein B0H11DRAFT_1932018 [Mycena galericulata]